MSDLPPTMQPGQLVAGKYRIESVLGRGGMGVVVAAKHEQLDQEVALKFLLPEAMRPDIIQRFLREARAAVKIKSEHVVRVFDVGTLASGVPFMVMEHLHGEDLSEVLRTRGPLGVEEAVGFLLEATEAVAEVHALGIVHRDLKPANLFLAARPSGRPIIKVLDFGISKVPTSGPDSMTVTAAMMGSPSYMSPEQMVAAKDVDSRSDIWSLGVVLYELLTQAIPFRADTMPEVVAAILSLAPVPVRQLRPEVPAALDAVISCCLEKDRERRYESLASFARALAPFGPPQGALSVERVTHILGGAPSSSQLQGPLASSRGSSMAAVETFGPAVTGSSGGTSVPGRPTVIARPAWVPAALAAAVVTVLVVALGATYALKAHASHAGPGSGVSPSSTPATAATATASDQGTERPAAITGDPSSSGGSDTAPAPSDLGEPPAHVPAANVAVASAAPRPTSPARPTGKRPNAPGTGAASSATIPPACRTESYFDSDGNKHFKQVCP